METRGNRALEAPDVASEDMETTSTLAPEVVVVDIKPTGEIVEANLAETVMEVHPEEVMKTNRVVVIEDNPEVTHIKEAIVTRVEICPTNLLTESTSLRINMEILQTGMCSKVPKLPSTA